MRRDRRERPRPGGRERDTGSAEEDGNVQHRMDCRMACHDQRHDGVRDGACRPGPKAGGRRKGRPTAHTARRLDPDEWSPRALRHSFVSLLSSSGVPIEDIAHLVGHASTRVTETVYRKELRPVLRRGAAAKDCLFPRDTPACQIRQGTASPRNVSPGGRFAPEPLGFVPGPMGTATTSRTSRPPCGWALQAPVGSLTPPGPTLGRWRVFEVAALPRGLRRIPAPLALPLQQHR
jgi:hypothetical protein